MGGDVLFLFAQVGADVQYILSGIRSNSILTPNEQVLLDGYRALDPATRRRMLAFMLGGDAANEKNNPASITVSASGHGTQAAGRKIVNRGKQ